MHGQMLLMSLWTAAERAQMLIGVALGDLQRQVGANIRRHRKHEGLTQEEFARRVGVHRTYLGGLERGERNLTLKAVESIAQQLGLEPLVLLASEEDRARMADLAAPPALQLGIRTSSSESAGSTPSR